jgi:hypothetical protein
MAMPLCGFNPKMLKGLTMFAQGLYEQALKRQQKDKIPISRAFEIEVEEMNIFLIKLDEKYEKELRPECNVKKAMEKLIEWHAFLPKK